LLVDTLGLMLAVHVTPQTQVVGAAELLRRLDRRHVPWLRYGWVDDGYRGSSWPGP
jgi:hypothetical protein